jgi:oligopeptide transport system ATP-binding protein
VTQLLKVSHLSTVFKIEHGLLRAVDDVSFSLEAGETLGIVGESGSGKSVTSLSIMRLVPAPGGQITAGTIEFNGQDLLKLDEKEMRALRGDRIAMIFQDPMTSLNPVLTVGRQLTEAIILHMKFDKAQARQRAIDLLARVGIPSPEKRLKQYPHEFSGGMRQRVMIAMALSCKPELLIADEPTTALDVTIQAQILELIKKLKDETGTSVILVTHDLGVVAGTTDDVVVMYAGKIMERAPTLELFARPGNPYTKGLLASVPDPSCEDQKDLYQIPGLPPDVAHLGPGCPFAPRCARAEALCHETFPPFVELTPDHHSLCHFANEVYGSSGLNR